LSVAFDLPNMGVRQWYDRGFWVMWARAVVDSVHKSCLTIDLTSFSEHDNEQRRLARTSLYSDVGENPDKDPTAVMASLCCRFQNRILWSS
jgi:hypothetical protein